MKVLTLTGFLILFFSFAIPHTAYSQDNQSKPSAYNKYTFHANIKTKEKAKELEDFLVKKESIYVAKADITKQSCMVICNDLIGEQEIFLLCNKVNIKTGNYKVERIDENEFKKNQNLK